MTQPPSNEASDDVPSTPCASSSGAPLPGESGEAWADRIAQEIRESVMRRIPPADPNNPHIRIDGPGSWEPGIGEYLEGQKQPPQKE